MTGKTIILFGTGRAAEQILWLFNLLSLHIECCVDNDKLKWGKSFNGLKVCNPSKLNTKDLEQSIVVVASSYFSEISSQLKDNGFQEEKHFIDGLDLLACKSSQRSTEPTGLVTEPRTTMLQAMENMKELGFYPRTVIDVGVAYGTLPLLKAFPKSKHILIEPLQEFEEAIRKLGEDYPIEYINAAAGRYSGKVTFNIHRNITASSMYEETDGEYVDGIKRIVNMIKLDQLIKKYEISDRVLLKVDVQGAELDVLDGAENLLNVC